MVFEPAKTQLHSTLTEYLPNPPPIKQMWIEKFEEPVSFPAQKPKLLGAVLGLFFASLIHFSTAALHFSAFSRFSRSSFSFCSCFKRFLSASSACFLFSQVYKTLKGKSTVNDTNWKTVATIIAEVTSSQHRHLCNCPYCQGFKIKNCQVIAHVSMLHFSIIHAMILYGQKGLATSNLQPKSGVDTKTEVMTRHTTSLGAIAKSIQQWPGNGYDVRAAAYGYYHAI